MKKSPKHSSSTRPLDTTDLRAVTGGRDGRNPQTGDTIQIPGRTYG